jgi:hypothetical protein
MLVRGIFQQSFVEFVHDCFCRTLDIPQLFWDVVVRSIENDDGMGQDRLIRRLLERGMRPIDKSLDNFLDEPKYL